jgi:IS5 family transposase
MEYSETRIYKLAKESQRLARKVVKPYSSRFSKKTFTQDQHIAILCIKTKVTKKFYETEEVLSMMPPVQGALGLTQVPDYTTMCKALKRLRSRILVVLLYLSACLLPCSGETGIDGTCFDRRHSSKHYIKRCKIRIGSMKVTFIVDTKHMTILGVHITVTRKHDTQIIIPLVNKTAMKFLIKVLTGDKGYDDQKIRKELRSMGIRPLIRHREFKPVNKAQNARMKKKDYHQRSKTETVNSMVKRKYSDTLYTKTFWNQVKEVLFMAVVHNIERKIMVIYWRISIEPTNLK